MNPSPGAVGFNPTSSTAQGESGRQVAEGEQRLAFTGEDHLAFWTRNLSQSPGYVYVIQGEPDSPIKVGWAKQDVRARVATLQTGAWEELRLLYVLPGSQALEWQLHRKIRYARVRGEWFQHESIPDFLHFVADLAQRMVAAYAGDGRAPDYQDFGSWYRNTARTPEVVVRFEEPSPRSPDEVAERLAAHWMRPRRPFNSTLC